MAAIVTVNVDLSKIPTDKIYEGKKGRYAELTVMINDETSEYGSNVSVSMNQTKEERDNKDPKTYVGNGKVLWNDGKITNVEKEQPKEAESDLPF
jgi:hypothetical protein